MLGKYIESIGIRDNIGKSYRNHWDRRQYWENISRELEMEKFWVNITRVLGFRRQYWENISRILGLETILENISRKEKPSEEQHFCKQ